MLLTKWISSAIVLNWKALPIVAMALVWLFFSGFRTILKLGEKRMLRELLLCAFCFGIAFALLCFGSYGLVDPANGLARAGALPPSPESLKRFSDFGQISLAIALAAGIALEFSLRRGRVRT